MFTAAPPFAQFAELRGKHFSVTKAQEGHLAATSSQFDDLR